MELFQIFWDDQNKLFLEFTKEGDEKQLYLPDKIRGLNLQFEIAKQEMVICRECGGRCGRHNNASRQYGDAWASIYQL